MNEENFIPDDQLSGLAGENPISLYVRVGRSSQARMGDCLAAIIEDRVLTLPREGNLQIETIISSTIQMKHCRYNFVKKNRRTIHLVLF